MMTSLKKWLAPPPFEGTEENNRLARLLHILTTVVILYIMMIGLGNVIGGRTPTVTLLLDALVLMAAFILRQRLRPSNVIQTGILLVVSGFVLTTLLIISLGTIRTPTTSMYLFLVVMAGSIFERKGILICACLCSLAVLALILAERAGLLPPPDYTVTITQWITYTAVFGLTGALAHYSQQSTLEALNRSKKEIEVRNHAEIELRKLLQAVEQSPASIVITDLDGNIEYVNPRFTQITGYSSAEAVGKNPRILKTSQTPAATHRLLWSTIATGKEWSGEFVNHKKDGTIYYESAIISPITNLNGVVTHYLAVKEDITERKRIEKELRASEARFRSLFEQTHDAVFILDLHGRYLTANQRAADMLGYNHDELLALSVSDISNNMDESREIIVNLLAGEHIPLYERLFRKKNGQVFAVEINVELVNDKNGNPVHIQSVVRDISLRKQTELALKTANEQLNMRIIEAEQLHQELREQVLHDPLTGLYNRRYLNETLAREIKRMEREHSALSIIAMDVDYFKKINDIHGHHAGDRFLIVIADLLKKHARGSDFICRYGGDEFLMILPGAELNSASRRAEEIRQMCAQAVIDYQGDSLIATLSFGVATYPTHGRHVDEIIMKADKALYASKENGRNRVTTWSE